MRSKSQILSKLRADGHITDEEYKILAQEPCEDAISKQAVLGKAIDYGSNTYLIPVNSVKALPPVTPQPKTGHWKRISIDKYSEHAKYWYRCDRCGKDNLGNTDWCPNCGTKMVESQESEG